MEQIAYKLHNGHKGSDHHGDSASMEKNLIQIVVSLSLKQGVFSVPKIEGLAVPKTVKNQSSALNSTWPNFSQYFQIDKRSIHCEMSH